MPYLAVIIPPVPEEHKDKFLAAFPTIAAEMKSLPMVLGVSGGEITHMEHEEVKDFKFFQTIAFNTKEDEVAFRNSDWVKENKAKFEAQGVPPPLHTLFRVADFPKDATPPPYMQFSSITVKDEAAAEKVKEAWEACMSIIGKPSWGGVSVDGDVKMGMGLVGWDSMEDLAALKGNVEAKAAWEKYQALGEGKNVIVKMKVY